MLSVSPIHVKPKAQEQGKTKDGGGGGKKKINVGGGTPVDPKYTQFKSSFEEAVYDRNGKAAYKILSEGSAEYLQKIANDWTLSRNMQSCLKGKWLRKCNALLKPYNENIDKKYGGGGSFWENLVDFGEKAFTRLIAGSPNLLIAGIYNAGSWVNWIKKETIKDHKQANLDKLKEEGMLPMKDGQPTYIENQENSKWQNIQYGSSNLHNAGCGIIAAYNTLVAMGESPDENDLVEMIADMEKSGAVISGLAGTAPKAIKKYFKKRGNKVEMAYHLRDKKVNRMGDEHTAFIALQLNDKDAIGSGGHYISITKEEKTSEEIQREKELKNHVTKYKFKPHNASTMRTVYPTLPQTILNLGDNPLVFCLMGIDKKVK